MDKAIDSKEMAQRVIMVTGGQRSGKSVFAEQLALKMSAHPTYLATARVMDEEMRRRVEAHKNRRCDLWRNLEAPLGVESLAFSTNETVLIDCLTMWAMNWLFEKKENLDKAISELKHQIDLLIASGAS